MRTILLSSISILLLGLGFFGMQTYENMQTTSETEQVFVYGTLLNPIVRFYACRCRTDTEPAILTGYRKEGRNIVQDASSVVSGLLLTVTPVELARFDRYEGVPDKYTRTRVLVDDTEVWVYVRTTDGNAE